MTVETKRQASSEPADRRQKTAVPRVPSPFRIPSNDPAAVTVGLLEMIFGGGRDLPFQFRLWNGRRWPEDVEAMPRFTIVLNHPGALRQMFLPPRESTVSRAYALGHFEIEGDVIAAVGLADTIQHYCEQPLRLPALLRGLLALPDEAKEGVAWRGAARLRGRRHSKARDAQAIVYHYDLPGDFYALFLDRRLQYSCAYFRNADDGLDVAQEAKLAHICRKLELKPGERLLDIGCGWGGLVAYAAKHFGVEAVGVTISPSQADRARRMVAEQGLQDRCRIEELDYRLVGPPASFDKLVSVGMFEHVGRKNLGLYFDKAFSLLRPGGRFLCHGIAGTLTPPKGIVESVANRWLYAAGGFIREYVFPDGELIPIGETLTTAEEAGFEVRDVESLREHYALTLRHWLQRLEARWEDAVALVGEPTTRIWRLFFAGSAFSFDTGRNNIYQSLLIKRDTRGRSGLPLTREYMYPSP